MCVFLFFASSSVPVVVVSYMMLVHFIAQLYFLHLNPNVGLTKII